MSEFMKEPLMMVNAKQYGELLDALAAKKEDTLRDRIAIAAMQGMLADGHTLWDSQSLQGNPEAIAKFSYEIATAMLKVRGE